MHNIDPMRYLMCSMINYEDELSELNKLKLDFIVFEVCGDGWKLKFHLVSSLKLKLIFEIKREVDGNAMVNQLVLSIDV